MKWMVGYDNKTDHVFGRIEGALTKDIAFNYFTRVVSVAVENDCTKVLTDVRDSKLMANDKDMEELAGELAPKIGLLTSFKRALLVNGDVKAYKTWENFCFKNGHKNMRIFSNEEVALEWLSARSIDLTR